MTYISRCEHGIVSGLCRECFPIDYSKIPDFKWEQPMSNAEELKQRYAAALHRAIDNTLGTEQSNDEPVAWKTYEEVHFSDQYIMRWVREGDEYVNRITKEMMEDFKEVVRQQQAEIESLKRQVKAQDNSIAALDMMIAQFEDKFGDYEKVINGNYAKVKPNEFIAAVAGKEHIVGRPIMYSEWPMGSDE